MHICPNCNNVIDLYSDKGLFKCPSCSKSIYIKDGSLIQYRSSLFFDNCSKIKIGTRGFYKNLPFTVIGSIQLMGLTNSWTEWCVQFNENSYAWLSEIAGSYTLKVDNSALNSEIIPILFGSQSFRYLLELVQISPPLYNSIILLKDKSYSYSSRLVGEPNDHKGILPFSPSTTPIEFIYSRSNTDRDFFVYSSLTNTYLISRNVNEYELNLYDFRMLSDYFVQTGGKKYRITSVPCPSCSSPNPKIVGLSDINFCIVCGAKFCVSFKNPQLIELIKVQQIDSQEFFCGYIGNILDHTFLISGVIVWSSKNNNLVIDYHLYSKNKKNQNLILRKIADSWFFVTYQPLNDTLNVETYSPPGNIEIFSPISIAGTFPIDIDYESTISFYFQDDIVFSKQIINKMGSEFIFSSNSVRVKNVKHGNKFKFVYAE